MPTEGQRHIPAPWRLNAQQLFGVGEQDILPDNDRRKNTLTFALIGLVVLGIWGTLNRTLHPDDSRLLSLGAWQLASSVVLMLPATWLAATYQKPIWSENLLVFSGFVIFNFNNVFGGQAGDALYWSFVYPYLVFFLRGQKVGWVVGLLFSATAPLLLIYSSSHWDLWTYRTDEVIFYGVAYSFNVLTAAHFNVLRSVFQKRLWDEVAFNTHEARKHLEALRYNATHDLGTQLFNRQGLIEKLNGLLAQPSTPQGSVLTLVRLKLERVSELRSIISESEIDHAMRKLADQLENSQAGWLCNSRTRHDELTLAMQSASDAVAHLELLNSLDHLDFTHSSSDFSLHEEWVCGIATSTITASTDVTDLLRKADMALLHAQSKGERWSLYDAALDHSILRRNRVYERLRTAVHHQQMALHYQPQVDLKTGRLVGAEALARWQCASEGPIYPDEFIPIIESTGLLQPFSLWTVDQAIKDCAHWQMVLPNVGVSVNLSADALNDPTLLQQVRQSFALTGLKPELVTIELTESVLLGDPQAALRAMNDLLAMGIKLSIDDYGVGFSSLTYVKQLPAHELKIDKSFVQELPHNSKDLAIVESSIELAHDFGLLVLAEGVETQENLVALMRAGCDLGQGWFFAKALPPDQFEQLPLQWFDPPDMTYPH